MKIELEDVIEEYIQCLYQEAEKSSEELLGEVTHAFIHGYTKSNLRCVLSGLELSKKQMKYLINYIEYTNKKVGV